MDCSDAVNARNEPGSHCTVDHADANSAANIGALVYTVRTHTDVCKCAGSSAMPPSRWVARVMLQIGTMIVVWYVFNRLLCDRFAMMETYDPSHTNALMLPTLGHLTIH
jgi:hypothetical protein